MHFLRILALTRFLVVIRYIIFFPVPTKAPYVPSDYRRFPWIDEANLYDPQAQIRCIGSLPDHLVQGDDRSQEVPLRFRYNSVRELCAKPAYGGRQDAFTVGAYCGYNLNGRILLERQMSATDQALYKNFVLLCLQRCRCVKGSLSTLIEQGRPALEIRADEAPTMDISKLDPNPLTPFPDLTSSPIEAHYFPIRATYFPERAAQAYHHVEGYDPPRLVKHWIGPPSYMRPIMCISHSASVSYSHVDSVWFLSHLGNYGLPFEILYASMQQICAVQWYGGSPAGNAGYFCRRGSTELQQFWPLTHPAFTQRDNPRDFMFIRNRCARACRCLTNSENFHIHWLERRADVSVGFMLISTIYNYDTGNPPSFQDRELLSSLIAFGSDQWDPYYDFFSWCKTNDMCRPRVRGTTRQKLPFRDDSLDYHDRVRDMARNHGKSYPRNRAWPLPHVSIPRRL